MVSALTDQQVIDYIKKQSAAGKTEQQIGKELLAKGVTPDQAKRIKAKYEAQQRGEAADSRNSTSVNGDRRRGNSENSRQKDNVSTRRNYEKVCHSRGYRVDLLISHRPMILIIIMITMVYFTRM
ncbi:hypothetical protein [uncultured Duncaniella sp.]|uniref:hypothetical protein n=1 Tax=uncultured Duncaniella sp. TaxID=2768039 RepID=UPI00266EDC5F|nr:hypothetical protein [uncultured Duncaniella sp.]